MKTTTKKNDMPTGNPYSDLVAKLAEYSEQCNELAVMEADLQARQMEAILKDSLEYSLLLQSVADQEAQIEAMAIRHPEWFVKPKTLKTPCGEVSFRTSTKLEPANEDLTMALIEQRADKDLYLRTRNFLNIEALETLSDVELAGLKITRVTTDKCTVKPMKVDLGKAVKMAEKGGVS